jgi:hypothetical protein
MFVRRSHGYSRTLLFERCDADVRPRDGTEHLASKLNKMELLARQRGPSVPLLIRRWSFVELLSNAALHLNPPATRVVR